MSNTGRSARPCVRVHWAMIGLVILLDLISIEIGTPRSSNLGRATNESIQQKTTVVSGLPGQILIKPLLSKTTIYII